MRGRSEGLGLGVALTVAAGISWAVYGLAQKQLLKHFSAQQVLWMIYVGAVVVMLPASDPAEIHELDGLQLGMLVFCCANTLARLWRIRRGALHWDLSRVSAVLATAPLFTISAMWAVEHSGLALVAAEGSMRCRSRAR